MSIEPLGDRVLVKRLEANPVTKGGIVIPDMAKEKPKQGEIIKIGTIELPLNQGDKILFSAQARRIVA